MAANRTVAIVVPRPPRVDLLADEEISFRHLCHFLGKYDKYFVLPEGSPVNREGFQSLYFPRKFFGDIAAHTHLLFWPQFYRSFSAYEYILIYHLDSLVFSDQLTEWCRSGWDYIGAPWLPCPDTPWVREARVGNGGFTLMHVESSVRALSNLYRQKPIAYWMELFTRNRQWTGPLFSVLERVQRAFSHSATLNRIVTSWREVQDPAVHGRNNDFFWSFDAAKYLPSFKVAPVEEGLRFAFEAAPATCFELNGRKLPFGCHAWPKYDRAFWEPHLLPPGGSRSSASYSALACTDV